jgi:CheY-like chemotaxis protein
MAGPKVLVVDDEPLIAMLLQDWLEELDYHPVGPAHSVSEALNLINDCSLDAAILDVSIGNEDSYPVADMLKARAIPFAFATGGDERSILPAHAGVALLNKPYTIEALRSVMDLLSATRSIPPASKLP